MHSDNKKAVTKQKELVIHQQLSEAGIEFEYQHHIPFRACGLESETTCAYVDFAIAKPWGYVLLECDEHQHSSYDPSCDVRRDFDIAASIALGSQQKLLIVRFNPDSYMVNGKTRSDSKDRMKRLLKLLDYEPINCFERVFLCYDHEAGSSLPSVAAAWATAATQVSRMA